AHGVAARRELQARRAGRGLRSGRRIRIPVHKAAAAAHRSGIRSRSPCRGEVTRPPESRWPDGSGLGIGSLWPGLQIRHLAALAALAQEGSFGRAAERLGYTQSAISQQIAALERLVGQRLVERPGGTRPVRLTPAGHLLEEHAEAILSR